MPAPKRTRLDFRSCTKESICRSPNGVVWTAALVERQVDVGADCEGSERMHHLDCQCLSRSRLIILYNCQVIADVQAASCTIAGVDRAFVSGGVEFPVTFAGTNEPHVGSHVSCTEGSGGLIEESICIDTPSSAAFIHRRIVSIYTPCATAFCVLVSLTKIHNVTNCNALSSDQSERPHNREHHEQRACNQLYMPRPAIEVHFRARGRASA